MIERILRFKYMLLYLFMVVYIYFSANGSYIEFKKAMIMNEFYTIAQRKNVEIAHFSSYLARSGTYILSIRYYTPNTDMRLDDYGKVLYNDGWNYQKQVAAYNNNVPIVGNEFAKDRIRVGVYLLEESTKGRLVSLAYYYEKN